MGSVPPFTAEDLTTLWSEAVTFPFVEDENCNITGYGHQDPAAFADEVNRYDVLATSDETILDEERWTAADISHAWAIRLDEERFDCALERDEHGHPVRYVEPSTPDAFPITTLWGQR